MPRTTTRRSQYKATPFRRSTISRPTPSSSRVMTVPMEVSTTRYRPRRRNIRTAGFIGIEKKFLDCYASAVAIGAAADCSGGEMQPEGGCTNCISAPAQGDGESNRDGRRIIIKSVFVTGTVGPTGTISDQADVVAPPVVYVALVLDTQANGATIVSEQVYTNPNDTSLVNAYPLRNLEYSSRYRVVAHKTLNLGPVSVGTDGANTNSEAAQTRPFVLSWNGNLPVTFTSTTADVANVSDNAFHIIAFATSTNHTPVISYNSRIRFVG